MTIYSNTKMVYICHRSEVKPRSCCKYFYSCYIFTRDKNKTPIIYIVVFNIFLLFFPILKFLIIYGLIFCTILCKKMNNLCPFIVTGEINITISGIQDMKRRSCDGIQVRKKCSIFHHRTEPSTLKHLTGPRQSQGPVVGFKE